MPNNKEGKKPDKSFHPNQTDQNQQDDSSQVYYIRPSGVRKPTSIRVDTGLWEAFKKTLSQKGLSTCEILENIILGLTVGIKASEEHVIRSTTINVYAEIPKFVKRVRRARVEYVDERVEDSGVYVDYYDGDQNKWMRKKVENDWDVNENGHFVGCQCTVCRESKKKNLKF
jgi:hypothetical protein